MTGGEAGMTGREAGMTGGEAGMTGSKEMTAGTETAPETCNSSLGTPIDLLAHKRVMKNRVTRIRHRIMPSDIHTTSQTIKASCQCGDWRSQAG